MTDPSPVDATTKELSQSALVFLTPWPMVVFVITAGVCLAFVTLTAWRAKAFRPLQVTLRLLAIACTLAVASEPAIQRRRLHYHHQRVALIVDTSQSMHTTMLGDTASRLASVHKQLRPILAALKKNQPPIDVALVDLNGGAMDANTLSRPQQPSRQSLYLPALRALKNAAATPLAAAIIVSDGAETEILADEATRMQASANTKASGPLSARYVDALKKLDIKVSTVAVNDAQLEPDLALTELATDAYAYVKDKTTLVATVCGNTIAPKYATISLSRHGVVIDRQQVALVPPELNDANARFDAPTALGPGHRCARAKFDVRPETLGEIDFAAKVEPAEHERYLRNNSKQAILKVLRDKVRVLQVVGRPSFDARFLRQLFKSSSNVDLISFFILRTPSDDTSIPESELSLIPFPVHRLFTTELKNFDVIVMQNFDFRPYHMGQYLPNIHQAIADGLGFVVLGGAESFGGGGYEHTPLADAMALKPTGDIVEAGPWQTLVTAQGSLHPVLDVAPPHTDRKAFVATLPTLDAINVLPQAHASAQILARAKNTRGDDFPVMAAMDVEKGRSLAIATDSLWRWQFSADADVQSEHALRSMWGHILRWLSQDPQAATLQIIAQPPRLIAGDDMQAEVRALVAPEELKERAVDVERKAQDGSVQNVKVILDEDGTGMARFNDAGPGAFLLTAKTQAVGAQKMQAAKAWVVVDEDGPEVQSPQSRPDILKAIGDLCGGLNTTLAEAPNVLMHVPRLKAAAADVTDTKNVALWDTPWALVALIGVWCLEWAVRRRMGLR